MKFDSTFRKHDKLFYNVLVDVSLENVLIQKENIEKLYSNRIKIKGFRQGRIPNDILYFHCGSNIIDDIKNNLVKYTVSKITKDNKINPIDIVSLKYINNDIFRHGFKYSLTLEVLPTVKIKSWVNPKITIRCYSFDIQYTYYLIQKIRVFYRSLCPSQNVQIMSSDLVTFSCMFYNNNNNEKIDVLSKSGLTIEVGKSKIYPEIDKELLNYSPGDNFTMLIRFSSDFYIKSVQNLLTLVKVNILEVKKKVFPILDTPFFGNYAKRYQCLNDFNMNVILMLNQKMSLMKFQEMYKNIINQIYKHNKFVVPQSYIDKKSKKIVGEYLGKNKINRYKKPYWLKKIKQVSLQSIKEKLIFYFIVRKYKASLRSTKYDSEKIQEVKRKVFVNFFFQYSDQDVLKVILPNKIHIRDLNLFQ